MKIKLSKKQWESLGKVSQTEKSDDDLFWETLQSHLGRSMAEIWDITRRYCSDDTKKLAVRSMARKAFDDMMNLKDK